MLFYLYVCVCCIARTQDVVEVDSVMSVKSAVIVLLVLIFFIVIKRCCCRRHKAKLY
jgi:hypothetical protein